MHIVCKCICLDWIRRERRISKREGLGGGLMFGDSPSRARRPHRVSAFRFQPKRRSICCDTQPSLRALRVVFSHPHAIADKNLDRLSRPRSISRAVFTPLVPRTATKAFPQNAFIHAKRIGLSGAAAARNYRSVIPLRDIASFMTFSAMKI